MCVFLTIHIRIIRSKLDGCQHGLLGNKENRKNPALFAYAAKVNATLSLAVIYFKPFSVCLYTLAQIYLDTLSNPVHPRSNKYIISQ